MRSISTITIAGTVTVLSLTGTTANAFAAEAKDNITQRQVNQVLAAHPQARQSAPGTVTFADGALLTIPEPGARTAACPSGWYCFYENNNFGGRRLQFRDCGGTQYLTNYGFGNKTSSWQNTTKHTVYAYDNADTPPTHLWTEEPPSAAASVGAEHDNRADSFYTACG